MNITDVVQLISLPLEITGLTLTILEVFYLSTSKRFEVRMSKTIEYLTTLPVKIHNRVAFSIVIIMFVSVLGLAQFGSLITNQYVLTFIEFLAVLTVGIVLTTVIYPIFNLLLPNRKILVIGFVLSTLGLFGEVFQVFNIFY